VELKITTSSHSDCSSVSVRGEIDLHTAPYLHSELLGALEGAQSNRVVVDMSEVGFCDSSGLSVLVSGMKRARENGGDLELLAPGASVAKVLEVTGLDAVFVVHGPHSEVLDTPMANAAE
jgi:anti-sigma B factor antagonist